MAKKVKQGHLDGMEPPSILEIDAAADKLADTRKDRMALTKLECEQADELLALMRKHKLKVYEYDSKRVEVSVLEKVRVKRDKDANGESEDE